MSIGINIDKDDEEKQEVVEEEPALIESNEIEISETETKQGAVFKEGVFKKKGASFKDIDDYESRYRLKILFNKVLFMIQITHNE